MDFTIAASNFMRSNRFLDLELQKELGFAITTIELAVIDNVVLHGRFMFSRSILRDRHHHFTMEFVRRVRKIPVRPVGWRSLFLPCLGIEFFSERIQSSIKTEKNVHIYWIKNNSEGF